MKRDIYEQVTAKILAELESGVAPWVKPWRSIPCDGMPLNASSGTGYSGGNIILLWMHNASRGYTSNRFMTYKQAQDLGGNVRKGETGCPVYYVGRFTREDDEGNKFAAGSFLKGYTVFNVEQIEGLPEKALSAAPKIRLDPSRRNPLAEDFIKSTGADFAEIGGDRCYYSSTLDHVRMARFEGFKSGDAFYNVAFHELGHWTGHKSRLDRDMTGRFGERAYAFEELVAELTSAFLCAEFGFDGELTHAGYIASWIGLLKSNPRAFVQAGSAAQKAADFLRGKALQGEIDEPQPLAA